MLADYAAARMVRLCIEPIPGRALPGACVSAGMAAGVDHPNLALLLDVGHCLIAGEDPAAVARAAGSLLGYVHLDDNDGVGDLHWPLLTGRLTATHLTDLAASLRDVGYTDGLCLEFKAAASERASVLRASKEIAARLPALLIISSHPFAMVQLHSCGEIRNGGRSSDSEETRSLLRQVRGGDGRAFDRLFAHYQPRLQRFVELRIDPKLRPRVDPADVVQEAHMEAMRRLGSFLDNPVMPFRLWIRQITLDRLLMLRRRHVGAARRSVEREAALPDGSAATPRQLTASASSPSQHAGRQELAGKVREAVARLAEDDREIILMRTFEGLAFEEVARLLGVESAAARKRHGRALLRLHQLLIEDGVTESQL